MLATELIQEPELVIQFAQYEESYGSLDKTKKPLEALSEIPLRKMADISHGMSSPGIGTYG